MMLISNQILKTLRQGSTMKILNIHYTAGRIFSTMKKLITTLGPKNWQKLISDSKMRKLDLQMLFYGYMTMIIVSKKDEAC